MFGVVPKSLWQRRLPADELNRIPMGMRCLLIEHAAELGATRAEGEDGEDKGADGRRGADVDEELGDRKPVPHQRAGVGDQWSGRRSPELEGREEAEQGRDQQEGWSCCTNQARHGLQPRRAT